MNTGIVYDPVYLKHDTGGHPENGRRLKAIIDHLEKTGLKEKLTVIAPRAATTQELLLVHHREHVARVQAMADGGGWLDPDTVMSPGSYEAALYAAGGVITATDAVITGKVTSAFALVRPPGHHATLLRAMGFCLFNNIAIAAKYALREHKLERIAIIDFDVHHGNGTQEAFYDNPQVLYISTHQSPFYPGTGDITETGSGVGRGTTVNIPLPAGGGDAEYLAVFPKIVAPAVKRFNPQLIMVSAGYDPHWTDTLALMQVTTTGFAGMTGIIKGLADELCLGRLVFTLEGGYNQEALATSVKATFDVLMGKTEIEDPLGKSPRRTAPPDITSIIKHIKEGHALP